MRQTSLLPLDTFYPMLEPLCGRRIGYLRMYGNAGDRMLDAATKTIFDSFGVSCLDLGWRETNADMAATDDALVDNVDEIVVSGGGNLGGLYPRCRLLREHYLGFGKPVTILPQTITGSGEDLSRYHRVFLRERESFSRYPAGTLGPDMALGLAPPTIASTHEFPLGVFLRQGKEALFANSVLSLADPAQCCDTYQDYFVLAARFEKVITDRLHFAIAALLTGVEVELLPVNYHKNRSMFDTWLQDLGCGWRDSLEGIRYERDVVAAALGETLATRVDLGRAL